MKLIFSCGGTAGHINPAIAVANMMKQRYPDANILFIGATGRMEEKLVPQAGYELKCLPGSGLSRGKNLAAIKKNLYAVKCVISAVGECKKIYKEFKPDAVIGTGGYASFPALYAAQSMGIPTCVHESNALPGITTKLAANKASRVLVTFEDSVQYYKHPEKVEVVGMPVHQGFYTLSKEAARKELGLGNEPLVVSAFGSLGAKVMNEMTADMLALEKADGYPYQHIHAVGKFGWEWLPKLVKEKGVDTANNDSVFLKEYIYNMPTVMAAADIVISRAGGSSCNEIAAAGIPCILIPSPNVTANHQEKNARALEEQGAAIVILEKDCTAEVVLEKIKQLLDDHDAYQRMREALLGIAVPDSAERMCAIMEELTSAKTKR